MSMAARRREADITGEMTWGGPYEPTPHGRGKRQHLTVMPDELALTLNRSELHAVIDALRQRLLTGFDAPSAALLQRLMTQ